MKEDNEIVLRTAKLLVKQNEVLVKQHKECLQRRAGSSAHNILCIIDSNNKALREALDNLLQHQIKKGLETRPTDNDDITYIKPHIRKGTNLDIKVGDLLMCLQDDEKIRDLRKGRLLTASSNVYKHPDDYDVVVDIKEFQNLPVEAFKFKVVKET